MTHTTRNTLMLTALVALVAFAAVPAGAIVPPRNCGTMTVGSKRYQVKTDQLRCSSAKKYTATYIRSHRKPSGYKCADYKASQTSLKFRCVNARTNPDRTFFAIRK